MLTAALFLSGVVTAQDAEPTRARRSTNDGVYSEAQAARGKVLFEDVCLVCHTDPFWKPSWHGRSLGDLYAFVLRFMPDDNPGSLSSAEAASALAYILRSNGVAAGTAALPEDATALERIIIDEPPPAR